MSESRKCRNISCTEEHPEFYSRMATCKKCYNRKTYLKRKNAVQPEENKDWDKIIESKDKEISKLINIIDTLAKRLDDLSV